jgi:hypothetical protein
LPFVSSIISGIWRFPPGRMSLWDMDVKGVNSGLALLSLSAGAMSTWLCRNGKMRYGKGAIIGRYCMGVLSGVKSPP